MSSISQVHSLPGRSSDWRAWAREWSPAVAPALGALLIVGLRLKLGPNDFFYDGTLAVLALVCYLAAAVIGLVELYAAGSVLGRWGLWLASAGLLFNAASWGTRWVAAGDREGWVRWAFRYVPFANLYDMSIAFAIGAGLTTVIIGRRREQRAVVGIAMLLAALILLVALFMGREFVTLPPVLDSFWRPIHVGVAALSYGVALVCFSLAVLYLIKDRVPVEALAVSVALFGVGTYAAVNRFSLLSDFSYSLSVLTQDSGGRLAPLPLRAEIPYAGPLMALAALLLAAALAAFAVDFYQGRRRLGRFGHLALRASALVQAASLGVLFYQMRTITDLAARVDVAAQLQFPKVMEWVGGDNAARLAPADLSQGITTWLKESNNALSVGTKSNPVEVAALIALLALTGLVVLFSFRPERLVERLPSLERLDGLVYKTAAISFVGLALLLITGAVWANESWGRYWGWDSKETGAFVAWVAYAGYLHTRITHGWSGRRSAYFAIAGFLLVIFTYLGVSYLLPGLHSYA